MGNFSRERSPRKLPERHLTEAEETELLYSLIKENRPNRRNDEAPCIERMLILKYVKKILEPQQMEEIKKHIKECNKCKDFALNLKRSIKDNEDVNLDPKKLY